jgi:hypothetical protein
MERHEHDVREFIALDDRVAKITVHSEATTLTPGSFYEFALQFVLLYDAKIDYAVLNISDAIGEAHAQCELRFPTSGLTKGLNRFSIRIGPLFLSRGRFSPHILITTQGGKTPLVMSRDQVWFDFEGPLNLGPKYYPTGVVVAVEPDFGGNNPDEMRISEFGVD